MCITKLDLDLAQVKNIFYICLYWVESVGYAKYTNAWVPKSDLVNKIRHDSFWIPKKFIHYVDSIRNYVEPRNRIIESFNLIWARQIT